MCSRGLSMGPTPEVALRTAQVVHLVEKRRSQFGSTAEHSNGVDAGSTVWFGGIALQCLEPVWRSLLHGLLPRTHDLRRIWDDR